MSSIVKFFRFIQNIIFNNSMMLSLNYCLKIKWTLSGTYRNLRHRRRAKARIWPFCLPKQSGFPRSTLMKTIWRKWPTKKSTAWLSNLNASKKSQVREILANVKIQKLRWKFEKLGMETRSRSEKLSRSAAKSRKRATCWFASKSRFQTPSTIVKLFFNELLKLL